MTRLTHVENTESMSGEQKVAAKSATTHDLESFMLTLPGKVNLSGLREAIADGVKFEVDKDLLQRAKDKLKQAEQAHAVAWRKAIVAELELRYLQAAPADIRYPGLRSALAEAEAAGVAPEMLEKVRAKLVEVLQVRAGVVGELIERDHLTLTPLKTDVAALREILAEAADVGVDEALRSRATE
eukprot:7133722-Prymnesium_polylepis.1